MASPEPVQLLRLFQRVAPSTFFDQICKEQEFHFRAGIYTLAVVVWLMICQRLQTHGTLAAAVQWLLQGQAEDLLNGCKRVQEGQISPRTGGYCQARQKLPTLVVRQVTDRVIEQLRSEMQEGWPGLNRPVVLIDGSTLQLPHSRTLLAAYPPGHNQHGANHWPVMLIVVFHDVCSGLCLRPSWGPMYGPNAVSEQALAEHALGRLPPEAVVLADCNFGIFAFAWAVKDSQRDMILRLTKSRAQKILGRPLDLGTDQKLVWEASPWERQAHPRLPVPAAVHGRLVVCENPSRPQDPLYLFTTLDLPGDEIVRLYKLRWNIETDLRSLKRTVGLHQLPGKGAAIVEKELLLAVTAYNLVRAVMCLAARRAEITPRQLSFSFVQTAVEAALPTLCACSSQAEYTLQLDRLLYYAAQGKLPDRSRPRSYPRQVWGRGGHFPSRTSKPTIERLPK